MVKSGEFVRLKVRIEYKKDITSEDLPAETEALSLGFTINYLQADERGVLVKDNGIKKLINIISGDGLTKSNEVCFEDQCFNVIASDDNEVKLFAKYNLNVGSTCHYDFGCSLLDNVTGLQDSSMLGFVSGYNTVNVNTRIYGTIPFSNTNYWASTVSEYPAEVYNENSNLYEPVQYYKRYLEKMGVTVKDARLISYNEIVSLGCTSWCNVSWLKKTTFWTSTAYDSNILYALYSNGNLLSNSGSCLYNEDVIGVRPVIVIPRDIYNTYL